MAFVVVVFDFGFGQGGFFDGGPHHRFGALIERAVHQEFHEFLGDDTFGVEIHCQVWVGPIAGDAKAFEFFALDVDPAFGKASAFLAEVDDGNLVLVLALGAVFFLDLPFDGKAVAIPAGHIACVKAHHLA